jgi:NitT/TauT family transport system permease protein
MKGIVRNGLNAAVVLVGLLLVWRGLIWWLKIPAYMLPTPWAVAQTVVMRFGTLAGSFLITASAAAGGLVASIVVGTMIALVFAQSRWLRRMFLPYTILLQTVPIVAIAPLIIMWVGAGLFAVTLITFLICLAPIIANTTQGLISVDENMVNLFLMQNASAGQILWKLRLPHALPAMFTGIRIASGISVIGAITGELFAGSSSVGQGGLGYSITYALAQLQTDYLFALVFAATILGFCFFFVVMFLEYYFLHEWHESARSGETGA